MTRLGRMPIFHWYPFYSICIFIGNGEKNVILYLPIESSMRTRYIANVWGTKYIATQKEEEAMKKTKGTRKSGYLQREQFYYPAHNFIDVSVPSFDYAIPRFFFGYLAAAIFCKNNRDYLLSVLLKVGAPLCFIPKRVHVSNCSNRAKKMQAGCLKYLVPWPFFRSTWKCGETPISSFSTLC